MTDIRIQWLGNRLTLLGLIVITWFSLTGKALEETAGLIAYPPRVTTIQPFRKRRRKKRNKKSRVISIWKLYPKVGFSYLWKTFPRMMIQSLVLFLFWVLSNALTPWWILLLPCTKWLMTGISVIFHWLSHQPEIRLLQWGIEKLRWMSLMLLIAAGFMQLYSGEAVASMLPYHFEPTGAPMMAIKCSFGFKEIVLPLLLCIVGFLYCTINSADSFVETNGGAKIEIKKQEGEYKICLQGKIHLFVKTDDPFRLRILMLFLRQWQGTTERTQSRATRDNRRPLISQQKIASWFGVTQPEISRWEKYFLSGDWANLLSLHSREILNTEIRNRIVEVMAHFPWWSKNRVYDYLNDQGINVTHAQIRQTAEESGWHVLKATLGRFFVISAESIRPRDEGLVKELLGQIKMLLLKIETGEKLTPEQRLEISHLKHNAEELNLSSKPETPCTPWALKMKWVLFTAGATMDKNEQIRCTYCGSTDVRVKSGKSRPKRYMDDLGQIQIVDVYRYYCKNPNCKYDSFTHMPLGLLPNTLYPLRIRLTALQMYEWGRSTYRRTGQAINVKAGVVYSWVSAFGHELLPIAALFGFVRSSGVVGVDEKWVQVPDKKLADQEQSKKNKQRCWMYVYLAIDAYTYDLLHIDIYAHNTAAATSSFLLALRAKGYKPKVIVTDLRKEYGPAIREIFPEAEHHECIFHALQWIHRQFKDVYGKDYIESLPETVKLKKMIDDIFQAKTKRTAQKRFDQVMSLRQQYMDQDVNAASIFDTLQRHWPTLVNSIESTIIPSTNNATELIIRRFDQHYKNFCGFESIETARIYLAVFEKVYRFTPFTEDAQKKIRNKSPLELAGYEISKLPMTQICQGWALDWPLDYEKEVVPMS